MQDLADICAKNDFELKEFAEWTPWSDFAANLPLRQGMASEQLIRPGEVQHLRDNESHYYFFVTEVAGSGQTAPLETRRATIRRILFNLRQAEVIRSHAGGAGRRGADRRRGENLREQEQLDFIDFTI